MKKDLDRLMAERDLDAFVVTGPARDNPAMAYMTNGAHVTRGFVIQKRGQEPVLICSPIERDEAAVQGADGRVSSRRSRPSRSRPDRVRRPAP